MKAATVTTPLVQAVENAWSKIQEVNEDVPDVVVTLGSGTIARGMKLGHFAANVWTRGTDSVHEIFVGAEGLKRGADAVMATLLHEAAHAAAEARNVKDTSRQGRYHNSNFKGIAESFGLSLEHSETLGWSTTSIPDETAALYETEIMDLDVSITAYRASTFDFASTGSKGGTITIPPTAPAAKRNNNGVSVKCECGRRIRVAKSVLELGAITCSVCGEDFAE